MAYPMPNITNEIILDIFSYANNVTNGLFSILMVFSIFLITFINFRAWRERGLTSALFITFLVTSLMRFAGIVQDYVFATVMIAFLASLFFTLMRRGR